MYDIRRNPSFWEHAWEHFNGPAFEKKIQNESRNVCLFVHSGILQYLLNKKARGNDDVSH